MFILVTMSDRVNIPDLSICPLLKALTWAATKVARRRQFRAQSEMEEEPAIAIAFHLLFLFMIYRRYTTTTEAGKDGGGAEKGR